tara:strand:- start:57 stop:485 length:429 start_codon:yes stop_codon:yes gene_type:complete
MSQNTDSNEKMSESLSKLYNSVLYRWKTTNQNDSYLNNSPISISDSNEEQDNLNIDCDSIKELIEKNKNELKELEKNNSKCNNISKKLKITPTSSRTSSSRKKKRLRLRQRQRQKRPRQTPNTRRRQNLSRKQTSLTRRRTL